MTFVADVARLTLRIGITLLLILGIAVWTGHGQRLIPIHMAIGLVFVLALWTLGVLGLATGRSRGLALLALAWGLLIAWLGVAQLHLLVYHQHWAIRVAHLCVGLAAMPIGEILGKRIVSRQASVVSD